MNDYSNELSVARDAAAEAARIIKKYRRKNDFKISFKGHNDLVTDADVAAEKAIIEVITAHFSEDQILAEESSDERIVPVERTWVIDPIDGTTNFAHGFPIFCVSIGLWEDQKPKLGLVLEVNSDEYFYATAGNGAFLNGDAIGVSSVDESTNAMVGTGFPYNDLSLMDNYIQFFEWLLHRAQGIRRPGAASYDLCCVAAGRFDGFYEYSLQPWDVGAAGLIVQEAGGIITDWEGDDNWLFSERTVAGNPEIHSFLLHSIQEHFPPAELKL